MANQVSGTVSLPAREHGALESTTPGNALVRIHRAAQTEVDRRFVAAQKVRQVRLHQRYSAVEGSSTCFAR